MISQLLLSGQLCIGFICINISYVNQRIKACMSFITFITELLDNDVPTDTCNNQSTLINNKNECYSPLYNYKLMITWQKTPETTNLFFNFTLALYAKSFFFFFISKVFANKQYTIKMCYMYDC